MSVDDDRLPVPIPITPPSASYTPEIVFAPENSLLVEFGDKRISGELKRIKGRGYHYSLKVINEAPLYLQLSFRIRRGGFDRPIDPGRMRLDPNSHADLIVDVPPILALMGGRLVVHMVNARLHHELVAPLPGASLWIGAIGGGIVASALAFLVSFAHPRLDVFTVPPVGIAGAPLQVLYEAGGIGTPSYVLEDENGKTIKSGTLKKPHGFFSLPLPAADRTHDYIVTMSNAGPLGVVDRAAPVTVMPPPAGQRQLIDSLALDTWEVPDGGQITVRYKTTARSGRVEVRDANDTLWAHAPISSNGVTVLKLPRFGHEKDLRVTLNVEGGGQHSISSLGLSVAAGAAPAIVAQRAASESEPDAPSATAAAIGPVGTPVAKVPSGPLISTDGIVAADGTVRVHIAPGATNVRLVLETPDGSTLAAESVRDGDRLALIQIPTVYHGSVALISTYDRGSGEESSVKSLEAP